MIPVRGGAPRKRGRRVAKPAGRITRPALLSRPTAFARLTAFAPSFAFAGPTAFRAMIALALAVRFCVTPVDGGPGAAPPPTIVRLALTPESSQDRPIAAPTEADNTLEIDFPWPLEDWAGRGFTPDPERFAGDFLIDANRGERRMFVTPLVRQAHRILHVVLNPPGREAESFVLDLTPAPPGLAWRKVIFTPPVDAGRFPPDAHGHPLSADNADPNALRAPGSAATPPGAPNSGLPPTAASEIALIRDMRRIAADGDPIPAGRPGYGRETRVHASNGAARQFEGYRVVPRFWVLDEPSGVLGVCVDIANTGNDRLVFDPSGWTARAGGRVQPVRTVDFSGEVEPGAIATAFLVIAEPSAGGDTGEPAAAPRLAARINPRPVFRLSPESAGSPP